MPALSKISRQRLNTVDPDLRRVVLRVVSTRDLAVLCGHRNQQDQDRAFAEGKSKLRWPWGQHNSMPSRAVDLAPQPLDWNNRQAFLDLARAVLQAAQAEGVQIRWGGDWNRNGRTDDERFVDLPHFELA